MSDQGRKIVRVLLQNIEDGDRRKFEARSNDSDSGGGARDLRFRPETAFFPFFKKVLPERRSHIRKSKGVVEQIEILGGDVHWDDSGREKSAKIEVWPSTHARPNECRIATVSRLGVYDLIKDDPSGGRSIFMLFQQKNEVVRIYFTTETSLRNDNWDPSIKKFAAEWIEEGSKSAFLDLETKERYPHD